MRTILGRRVVVEHGRLTSESTKGKREEISLVLEGFKDQRDTGRRQLCSKSECANVSERGEERTGESRPALSAGGKEKRKRKRRRKDGASIVRSWKLQWQCVFWRLRVSQTRLLVRASARTLSSAYLHILPYATIL